MADEEVKSWPEFVGEDANDVEKKLTAEGYAPVILPKGAPLTRDYREDRVRLFVDDNNKIVEVPKCG